MFKDVQGKGFSLTFQNGLTIYVWFGYGNFCQNNMMHYNRNVNLANYELKSKDAEIAVWDESERCFKTDTFIDCENNTVKGYLSADEVADLINKVKNYN